MTQASQVNLRHKNTGMINSKITKNEKLLLLRIKD